MAEMQLRQLGFIYSACDLFKKNKELIQKFMKTEDTRYIHRNELDKACFQHSMSNGSCKDLVKRIESDEVLRDKAFKIASNPIYDGYEIGLASMVYKFFDKKFADGGAKSIPN